MYSTFKPHMTPSAFIQPAELSGSHHHHRGLCSRGQGFDPNTTGGLMCVDRILNWERSKVINIFNLPHQYHIVYFLLHVSNTPQTHWMQPESQGIVGLQAKAYWLILTMFLTTKLHGRLRALTCFSGAAMLLWVYTAGPRTCWSSPDHFQNKLKTTSEFIHIFLFFS